MEKLHENAATQKDRRSRRRSGPKHGPSEHPRQGFLLWRSSLIYGRNSGIHRPKTLSQDLPRFLAFLLGADHETEMEYFQSV